MALVSINYARAGITGSFNGATLICQRKRDETGAVQANRHLRRAVDRCLGDGIRLILDAGVTEAE